MKPSLPVAARLACACAVVFLASVSFAQQIDIAVGAGSISATKASSADSSHSPQSLSGGSYFSVSGDVLLHHQVGVEAEVAWKGSRGTYFPGGFNQPYRPLFYDVNAIWMPKIRNRMSAELMAGAGGLNTRFYRGTETCSFVTCTNFVTSNHFMFHAGGGLKYYVFHKVFIRPEAHLYVVHNNVEFSSDRAIRYGVSLGYTF